MQGMLLKEAMLHTPKMIFSMLVGFGVGVLFLGPASQGPTINSMVTALASRGMGSQSGRLRAATRSWAIGQQQIPWSSVQTQQFWGDAQQQPLWGGAQKQQPWGGAQRLPWGSAPKQQPWSGAQQQRQVARAARSRSPTVRTDNLRQKLSEAIKIALACKGDCVVEWDVVEELSAAVADSDATPEATEMSDADKQQLQAAQERIKAAQFSAPTAGEIRHDTKLFHRLSDARPEKQEVRSKEEAMKWISDAVTERMAGLEKKIQEAINTAMASKDPVDWDIVEELSAEKAQTKRMIGHAAAW